MESTGGTIWDRRKASARGRGRGTRGRVGRGRGVTNVEPREGVVQPQGCSKVLKLFLKPAETEGDKSWKWFRRVPVDTVELCSDGFRGGLGWHREKGTIRSRRMEKNGGKRSDRAVCCMSTGIYELLQQRFEHESLKEPCAFGENMLLQGLKPSELCIGDVFEFRRDGNRVATVDIPFPRRPCYKVDKMHGKVTGPHGVRQYSAETGTAGWFFRVLETGTLRVGDDLVLVQRKYPEFTLASVSSMMWSGTKAGYKIKEFGGSEEMLQALIQCPELGIFQWKESLWAYVEFKKNGGKKPKPRKRAPRQKKFWESWI